MGTRYIYGFVKDGKSKYTYGHYDGYPDGAGLNFKQQLNKYSVDYMRARFDRFIICEEEDIPEKSTIMELIEKKYINPNEFKTALYDDIFKATWYGILREWQGDLTPLMEYDTPYMTYADEFSDHQYRYTIDLDNSWFIIDINDGGIYNELITIPLLELSEMSDDEYCRRCEEADAN